MICYVFCTLEMNLSGNILQLLSPVLHAESQGCHHHIMLGILKWKARL